MPAAIFLPEDVYKREDGRWCRSCPSCGTEVDHLRRNYCVNASINDQPCKRCSNINNHSSGMVGSVRLSWYNAFKKSGLMRGYEWSISPEFLDAMYQEQKGRCVYSGLQIGWSKVGWNHTASVDRIDNEKGYTEKNVQLVHKDVNMMRGSLENDMFIELCTMVANNKVKW